MGFIKNAVSKNQARKDLQLLAEEKLYEYVGEEIESGNIRAGIWTKASSTASSGAQEDIQREYIRLRVEYLYAEGRLYEQFLREVSEATDSEQEVEKVSDEEKRTKAIEDDWDVPAVVGIIVAACIVLFLALALGSSA